MDRPFERFVAWLLRLAATALMFAGISMLGAAIPAFGLAWGSDVPRAFGVVLLQIAGACVVGGVAAKYLLRSRSPMLPNERITVADDKRPPLGGWLIVLALTLIAAPLWLVIQLRPFLAEWRVVYGYIARPEFWDNANANMSGVVLIPVAGVLTPPFLQLLTLIGFATASAIVVPMLIARSPRFPRIFVVNIVLLSALLFSSVRAMNAATVGIDALRQEIARMAVNAADDGALTDVLDRYTNAMRSAAPPLAWTWLAYVVWLPVLLLSARVRTTLANRVEQPITRPEARSDVATVTRPPRFPGVGF